MSCVVIVPVHDGTTEAALGTTWASFQAQTFAPRIFCAVDFGAKPAVLGALVGIERALDKARPERVYFARFTVHPDVPYPYFRATVGLRSSWVTAWSPGVAFPPDALGHLHVELMSKSHPWVLVKECPSMWAVRRALWAAVQFDAGSLAQIIEELGKVTPATLVPPVKDYRTGRG